MPFLRIIKDKKELKGTAYIELMLGKYTGQCWNQGSLFLDEHTFGFLEGIIAKQVPEYDHYAFTEVASSRWKPIIARLKGFAAEMQDVREPSDVPADICYFEKETEQRFMENLGKR